MADVELLPLPELPRQVEGYSGDYWEAGQVEEYATDYARACVEANLAPLQAENERLRAEVERLRTDGASAVRWAPSSSHWSAVLRELFGPNARDGIDATEARLREERERAERLAEALRGKVEIWESEGIRLNGGATKPYTDDENSIRAFVLGCCADELRALLREQEAGRE